MAVWAYGRGVGQQEISRSAMSTRTGGVTCAICVALPDRTLARIDATGYVQWKREGISLRVQGVGRRKVLFSP